MQSLAGERWKFDIGVPRLISVYRKGCWRQSLPLTAMHDTRSDPEHDSDSIRNIGAREESDQQAR